MRTGKFNERIMAPLLAFLVPGAGHLVLGLHLKGLLLVLGTLTDIVAMVRFADEGGGTYVLLIIFLGLALPFFWFYSVFDTLQQAALLKHTEAQSVSGGSGITAAVQGMAVLAIGIILLALVRAPSVLSSWLDSLGNYIPGIGLIMLSALLAMRRGSGMFKLGRITAACVIISVGGLLLWDQVQGRNDMGLLGQWWPAAFVLLGLEVVIYSFINRTGSKRLSFDIGGSFLAVLIAITAFTVTQYAAMPIRWLDEFKTNFAGISGFGEEKGFKYTKESFSIPVGPDLLTISVDNPNGKVSVKKGEVNEIIVQTEIWVDVTDQKVADSVAEQSKVEASGDKKLSIEAKGHPYGANGSRKPRMNMIITIPASSAFAAPPPNNKVAPESADENKINETSGELQSSNGVGAKQTAVTGKSVVGAPENQSNDQTSPPNNNDSNAETNHSDEPAQTKFNIQATNGTVNVSGLVLPGGLNIKITNGEANLSDLFGPVDVETKNGDISASDIEGDVQLSAYNGAVRAQQISGDFEASTLSGNMEINHISGHVEVDTKNGEILIKEALASVKADTLNGDIEIRSSVVGGSWDIDSSIGDIRLFIPEQGNYSVNGSVTFGTISTDLPLTSTKKTISGDIGAATYRIDIDANSSITVNRYSP
ncbi:DUF4097 domain-containing protein [Paenibacillus solisilvae]|uniref:DUF4097 domain-containing protein n=1 Tax=Paenibacillus solisilvae TaxID=2486751 RepID=A0ABW0VTY1_9BACL